MKVYAIFSVQLDGDGYRVFDLLAVGKSLETAEKIIDIRLKGSKIPKERINPPAHPSMTSDNNFTYIGKRADIVGLDESYDVVTGYVIEIMSILDLSVL